MIRPIRSSCRLIGAVCAGALAALPATVHAQALGTIAGTGGVGSLGDGGPAVAAQLNGPSDIALAADGAILVAERSANRVRRIGTDGVITTVAGTGVAGSIGDGGPAAVAQLNSPIGLTIGPDGSVYIAEVARVRRIDPAGDIHPFAGTGVPGDAGDGGPATAATLTGPTDVAVLSDGSVVISDAAVGRVRRVADGTIQSYAGTGAAPGPGPDGDGGPATAANIGTPVGVVQLADGTVLISDFSDHRVRAVALDGTITTLLGTGLGASLGDGALASAASVHGPGVLALAPDGSLLVAEFDGDRVRRVAPNGRVTTIAGGGQAPFEMGGPAVGSFIDGPAGLAALPDGGVVLSASAGHRIHHVDARLAPPTPGPAGPAGPSGPGGADGVDGTDGAAGSDGVAGVDGMAGATGPAGPPGPTGETGVAGRDRIVLVAALAAPRLTGTARRSLGIRLVLTTRATVTLELVRAGRRTARVRRALAPGRRSVTLRLPSVAGAYRLRLVARAADGQMATDVIPLAVRVAIRPR